MEDVRQARRQAGQLRSLADEQAQEIEQLRSELQEAKDQWALLGRSYANDGDDEAPRRRESDYATAPQAKTLSLSDLPQWAHAHQDEIIVHPRALNAAKKSEYLYPEHLFSALDFLATEYRSFRHGELSRADLESALVAFDSRAESGFKRLHLLLGRRRRFIFAVVLGFAVAVIVFTNLAAWWQIEMLGGLPMKDPERWHAAFRHALAALAAGATVAGLGVWFRRRRPGAPGSLRPAALAAAGAVLALAIGDLGLRLGSSAPVAPAPGAPAPGATRSSQVIVVGLDGLTLRVLSPLLRAGELPAFRRLMAEGAWGTLLTYGTAASPQVWTSMATGKRVRDHGIDDFVRAHDSAGYRADLMKSTDRRSRAVWSILSDAGRRVAVVDWLVTFPPEEVNGYMVSRLKLKAEGRTHPPELEAEFAGLWSQRPKGERRRLEWNIDRVFAVARHLLAKERLDFLAVYDATADRVEHQSWIDYQPEAFDPELWQVGEKRAGRKASLIPDVYRRLDRRLGELLDRVGEDVLVLVVSDHGQRAARTPRVRLRLDRVLAALGYCRLVPDGGPRDQVDYAASRAYTLVETPWTPVLRVNLNLRGREAQGVVDPAEADAVAEQLAADLRAVRFEDGTPLFTAVRTGRRRGADLRVALSRHARGLARSGDRLQVGDAPLPLRHYQRINPAISGAHDHQGVIFARGPGVEPGYIGQRVVPTAFHDLLWHLTDKVDAVDRVLPLLRWLGIIERASTLDLTPTVLAALGLPVARDMFGRPLKEIFKDPAAVEWIASYETGAEPRRAGEEVPSDAEELERLRALGYVDD